MGFAVSGGGTGVAVWLVSCRRPGPVGVVGAVVSTDEVAGGLGSGSDESPGGVDDG